ncbi:MAG: penicillin acylase family protein [Planctomycetes bacterium]|nr:penicillin acylase family protein [Planctomycetota bacterium]MBI3843439.1 penicillin acylase family protein [Planctomycetota bacterium]
MRRTLVPWILVSIASASSVAVAGTPVSIAGLQAPASIVRDTNDIAHVEAQNEHDAFLLQGWLHAQDRLFQMDVTRRQANGTLAELVGESALPTDVQLRTLGIRRAAERSFAALSPRAQAAVQAYADGVNAWVTTHPLPPEYGALEITHFEPWTPMDAVAVGKIIVFALSFSLDIDSTIALASCLMAGEALGFDGSALYFDDLWRVAPFDPASTVPDATGGALALAARGHRHRRPDLSRLNPIVLELGRRYLESARRVPLLAHLLDRGAHDGSNAWAVSGAKSANGAPMIANDPHLSLGTPATWYPIHLHGGALDATGSSFPGTVGVVLGHNRFVSWGSTANYADVTDTFQEQLVPDPSSPSGLSTVHLGELEPVIPIPIEFRQNNPGNGVADDLTVVPPSADVPPVALIVPRRFDGPILSLDLASGFALSVQWTGFAATREIDAILGFDSATSLADFRAAIQYYDGGSQNWIISDVGGHIAYFTSGEIPIREDLQDGTVNGLSPGFIRNGTGGNEWMAPVHPQPFQAVPCEILPFDEMPQVVDPPLGFFVNSNNDPSGDTLDNDLFNRLRPGGGIAYLSSGYDGGIRAGRITQLLRARLAGNGRVSLADMRNIQNDVALLDAEVFVPFILDAFRHARAADATPALAAFASNSRVASAVRRLAFWSFRTPTGIAEGYDASDVNGVPAEPARGEIAESVAATVYAVWRARFLANTTDAPLKAIGIPLAPDPSVLAALRDWLEHFEASQGVGASGLNFFDVPGIARAEDRRDIVLLQSLADALDRLASDDYAPAFHHSRSLNDYRWGKLHRVQFDHLLGAPFTIPSEGGPIPSPLAGLPGIPVDGGYGTVDVGNFSARNDGVDAFMYFAGPSQRYVSRFFGNRILAKSSLPGGVSGDITDPNFANLLAGWLTNDVYALWFASADVARHAASVTAFVPAP